MALIFYLSSFQRAPLPDNVSDKLAHMGAYAVLGVLVVLGLAGRLPVRLTWRLAVSAVLVTTLYGVSDELHQMFVPGRSADVFDVVADAGGAIAAVGVCGLWGILPIGSDLRGTSS
jgi:VanZ family protein